MDAILLLRCCFFSCLLVFRGVFNQRYVVVVALLLLLVVAILLLFLLVFVVLLVGVILLLLVDLSLLLLWVPSFFSFLLLSMWETGVGKVVGV